MTLDINRCEAQNIGYNSKLIRYATNLDLTITLATQAECF